MDIHGIVLYEDNDLIIVNKPGGLLSIQDGYNATLPYLKKLLDDHYGRVWTVHRLDKKTSGVMVFARNPSVHRDLNIQFSTRKISKEYIALVHGYPYWDQKEICVPLKPNGDRHHRTVPDRKHGKKAHTTFSILERYELSCRMLVTPKTGLTHQIRAHAAYLGFPVIGDPLYWRLGSINPANTYKYPFPFANLYLHAQSISFKHPVNNTALTFEAPLPEHFNHY